jgi:hypothetical protein
MHRNWRPALVRRAMNEDCTDPACDQRVTLAFLRLPVDWLDGTTTGTFGFTWTVAVMQTAGHWRARVTGGRPCAWTRQPKRRVSRAAGRTSTSGS